MKLKMIHNVFFKNKIIQLSIFIFILLITLMIVLFLNTPNKTILDLYLGLFSINNMHFVLIPLFIILIIGNNQLFFSNESITRYGKRSNAYINRYYFMFLEALIFSLLFFAAAITTIIIIDSSSLGMVSIIAWILQFLTQYFGFILLGSTLLFLFQIIKPWIAGCLLFLLISIDYIFVLLFYTDNVSPLYGPLIAFIRLLQDEITFSEMIISFWKLLIETVILFFLGIIILKCKSYRRSQFDNDR